MPAAGHSLNESVCEKGGKNIYLRGAQKGSRSSTAAGAAAAAAAAAASLL